MKKAIFTICMAAFLGVLSYGQTSELQKLREGVARSEKLMKHIGALAQVGMNSQSSRAAFTHTLDSIISTTGVGQVVARELFSYDDKGRLTQSVSYEINEETFELGLIGIYSFSYNDNDQLKAFRLEGPDEEGEVVVQGEGELFYENGRIDSLILNYPDPLTGVFGPLLANRYIYDGDNLVKIRQWLNFILLGGWIPNGETDYEYAGGNRPVVITFSTIDFLSGELTPAQRTEITYYPNNRVQSFVEFIWNDELGEWQASESTEYFYFANDRIQEEISSIYDFVNGQWINSYRTTYEVNNPDEYQVANTYAWDAEQENWIPTDSAYLELRSDLPIANVAYADFSFASQLLNGFSVEETDDYTHAPNQDLYYIYDQAAGEYVIVTETNFYYSELEASSVSDVLPEFVSITPNPATEMVNIRIDQDVRGKYNAMSLDGRMVARGTINGGDNVINTAAWTPGVYVLTFQLEGQQPVAWRQVISK